ncbi:MAG TPA: DUF928 domain-containing protein [Waterburya sp.]|jgi:hypothetical protein
MKNLPKMKLALVTVLASALLPHYALAEGKGKLFADLPNAPKTGKLVSQQIPGVPPIAELPPAPDTGTPDNSHTPGGSRTDQVGACKQTNHQLTALVPEKGNQGLTTAEYPVLWFYIPYASEDIHSIEFSLHDRDEKTTLYRASLQLLKTPGVMSIPLPPSPKHSLKLNQSYHWRLIVNCDPNANSENVLELDGWVTRVQPSPRLVGVIWYDELTNRAKRYLSEPQNTEVKKAWAELLKAVGLEELAQAPLVSSSQ